MIRLDKTPPTDPDEVLATVSASTGRRYIGMVSLALLGLMLIYLAIVESLTAEWRLVLLALGAGVLWLTDRMLRATATRIELTPTALRASDGTVIALVSDIEGLDRSFFAFKPSNGFLVHIRTKQGNAWRPGLWWRLGRRIGVGGMTSAIQTKMMSETIAVMLAQRDMAQRDMDRTADR